MLAEINKLGKIFFLTEVRREARPGCWRSGRPSLWSARVQEGGREGGTHNDCFFFKLMMEDGADNALQWCIYRGPYLYYFQSQQFINGFIAEFVLLNYLFLLQRWQESGGQSRSVLLVTSPSIQWSRSSLRIENLSTGAASTVRRGAGHFQKISRKKRS